MVRINDDNCHMGCPVGSETCGGKLAMEVFYTGVTVKREMQKSETMEQVRVVFILKAKNETSPKLCFTRKFEVLVDQHPVNELEESIGGLNRTSEGWDFYWLQHY